MFHAPMYVQEEDFGAKLVKVHDKKDFDALVQSGKKVRVGVWGWGQAWSHVQCRGQGWCCVCPGTWGQVCRAITLVTPTPLASTPLVLPRCW